MRRLAAALAVAIGCFLIVRAVVEPFVIDLGDPSTYERDWGGPSLAGVLLVHCGPGIVASSLLAAHWRRRR